MPDPENPTPETPQRPPRPPQRRRGEADYQGGGDAYDLRGMGLKEPWRSVAIGGTIAVVCVVMLYLVWRGEVRAERQDEIHERQQAAIAARESAFLQALQTNQGVFTSEVREVRERADKRADLQAMEVRNLAQEIRLSQAETKAMSGELRRLADSLIRTGGALQKAVEELPQKPKKEPKEPDPGDMLQGLVDKLRQFPPWSTTVPARMPEGAPMPRAPSPTGSPSPRPGRGGRVGRRVR